MSDLPALPPLDGALVSAWTDAHRGFTEAEASVSPPVLAAARRLLRRMLTEGLANVQPVLADTERPLLFPPPRRYLTNTLEERLAGAGAAFRYLDVAAAMHRLPGGPGVVAGCTPQVLNALLTGPVEDRETNPGLLRMTPTHWMPDANPFEHPDPSEVSALLGGAVDLAVHAPSPAVARAGWLAFVVMTVHPFVDGNGRTARALFVALSGSATEAGLDWGVVEQWALARDTYVQALQAGQGVSRYAGADVDPSPFMRFAAGASARGARINAARVAVLGEVADTIGADAGDVELLLHVMLDRFVALDVLLDETEEPNAVMTCVRELTDAGFLRLGDPPPGRSRAATVGRGAVVGDALRSISEQLWSARHSEP